MLGLVTAMGAYSLRSALVRTWPRLPYGTSPPRIDEMKRRGGSFACGFFSTGGGVFVDFRSVSFSRLRAANKKTKSIKVCTSDDFFFLVITN